MDFLETAEDEADVAKERKKTKVREALMASRMQKFGRRFKLAAILYRSKTNL